ncbi:MAG TPA: FAD-dependent oxidoreductase [Bryobacterales bacterium]|nr:FAD-dependent oxidoreductase [Bryobacterales bacterium]
MIRSIAGLRPHRDSGFVVRADKFDGKVIVHNYGHSGGGISLSWGSAHLAANLALETGATEFAVLGAGCMGLCTARLLQDRGASVTIYTKDLPPNTTSNVAGGQWSPLAAFSPLAPAEYRAQYETAARFANKYFQELNLPRYGIRWIPNYFLSERPFPNYETWAETNPIADLYKDYRLLERREHPFPVPHVQCFTTMLIEPPIFLSEVMRDLRLGGGKVAVREFSDVKQVLALPQRTVVNCTGLGAKALFGDEELMPIKGQLSFLVPQPEVDYITIGAGNLYMFPRHDGVLLGGTYKRGDWSLEPDAVETDRIIEGHRQLHGAMS